MQVVRLEREELRDNRRAAVPISGMGGAFESRPSSRSDPRRCSGAYRRKPMGCSELRGGEDILGRVDGFEIPVHKPYPSCDENRRGISV